MSNYSHDLLHIFPIQSMPTYEEVEALGSKPFQEPSSELQGSVSELAKTLGVQSGETTQEKKQEQEKNPDISDAQKKSDNEGQKVVDRYSGRIQEKSEEMYIIEERLALKDEQYLNSLVSSEDPLDIKLAEKILKRNSEHFGASSIEEYKIAQVKNDDPLAQEIAVQKLEINSLKKKQEEQEWSDWKRQHKIGEDVEVMLDEIHKKYPTMAGTDALALARGRMGLTQTTQNRKSSGAAVGGSGIPEDDEQEIFSSPLARRLLRDPEKTKKFAKEYLRQVYSS